MIAPPYLIRLMTPPSLGKLRLKPEDRIAVAFANRLRTWTLQGRLKAVWTHIGNEVGGGHGRKSVIAYTMAKALGLIPGTADYLFIWPGGGAGLECKAEKGRQSDNQKDFQAWCELAGVPYFVFRSADEGEAILKELGVLNDA